MRSFEYKVPQLSQGNLYPLFDRLSHQISPFSPCLMKHYHLVCYHQCFMCITGSLLQASWLVGLRASWTKADSGWQHSVLPFPMTGAQGMLLSTPRSTLEKQKNRGRKQEDYPAQRHSTHHFGPSCLPFLRGTLLILPMCLPAFPLWSFAYRKRGLCNTKPAPLCFGKDPTPLIAPLCLKSRWRSQSLPHVRHH